MPSSAFQIVKAKHELENLAFNRSINLSNRLKIESISNLSEKVGFQCFDWYILSPQHSLHVGVQIHSLK